MTIPSKIHAAAARPGDDIGGRGSAGALHLHVGIHLRLFANQSNQQYPSMAKPRHRHHHVRQRELLAEIRAVLAPSA